MANRDELMFLLETEYLSKIYGFSVMKMNTRTDAEDLSQEIVTQIIRTINTGKEIENFNAFVWSVSNHTFFNFLRKRKHVGGEYLPQSIVSEVNIEAEYILCEQCKNLRRELALLSKKYRQALVSFYFDEKSCEEIAVETGSSVGTVKWWLNEGRKHIKKGIDRMREYGEKSYKPGRLFVSCQGALGLDNEPVSCVRSKSTQNILLAAYQKPVKIEELCGELGIPAAYVEDDVEYLTKNQLLREVSAGKYQTDFVILPGNNTMMAVKLYQDCFPAYYEALISYLNEKRDILMNPRLNMAGFTWERLLWVYIHVVTDFAANKFRNDVCHIVKYQDIPDRPNGGKWIVLGFNNSCYFDAGTAGEDWKEYIPFDGPVQRSGAEFVQSFCHYWSGLDSSVFFDLPYGIFELCRNIIKGVLNVDSLNEDQKYLFSTAIEKGLFIRKDGQFIPNYFFVDCDGRRIIETLASDFYETAFPFFDMAWKQVLREYGAAVPKHLHGQMANFLSNHLSSFIPCSLYEALKRNEISEVDEKSKPWVSLFASEP